MEAKAPDLKIALLMTLAVVFLAIAAILPPCALSQELFKEDLSTITIEHKVPALKSLAPGKEIILLAHLKNTRQTGFKVRCLLSRDGRLMELPLERAFRNEYDVPTFEFKLTAPLAGATYYFVLYKGSGPPLVSERFIMQRECVPKVDLTDLNPGGDEPTGEKHLLHIRDQARGLEQDLVDYENAVRLLQELKGLLGEQQ